MKANQLISRYAPTPSGHLHLGNLLNFYLIQQKVKATQGKIILRIDDCEPSRVRKEYINEIFDILTWAELSWDEGPESTEDFFQNFSQLKKQERYKDALKLIDNTYQCNCSRKDISGLVYSGTCRYKNLNLTNECATRLNIPQKTQIKLPHRQVDLDLEMGDFVLFRKDQLASYQLVSCVDDLDMGVNYILRGIDLEISTAAQIYLGSFIGPNKINLISYNHHPLIINPTTQAKLSKSNDDESIIKMRQNGLTKEKLQEMILSQISYFQELIA